MNQTLSLTNLKPQRILAALQRNRIALIGAVLIGLFGYTAFVINSALNAAPAAPSSPAATIRFDKQAITTVKGLEVVPVSVPVTPGGKTDPFSR